MSTPTLKFYHANARGTGSALSLSLRQATAEADGAIIAEIIPQADRGAAPCPAFDNAAAIVARLRFVDVCEFVRVFRGEVESIADGKGIYIGRPGEAVRVRLAHVIEPVAAYRLELDYMWQMVDDARHAAIFLTPAEALGICLCFESSLQELAFGA
jgi:hypothetical protein